MAQADQRPVLQMCFFVLVRMQFCSASFTQIINPSEKLEWWQTTVIYQILPYSFKDSDGDGIGDLNGITQSLNYFTDTGIKTLWLSPFFKSPMLDAGYDISDYEAINPLFGTMKDFEQMVKKMKESGINLIIDLVPNHTSDEHEWFKKSVKSEEPFTDFYIWRNASGWNGSEPLVPNNWINRLSEPSWKWNDDRKQFYYHQFASHKPDLNYWNSKVRNKMKDVLRFWLDKGIDGIKVDSITHLVEDPYFRDEPVIRPDLAEKDYERYDHHYTVNHDENFALAKEFRSVLDEYKKKDGKTRLMTVDARAPVKVMMKFCGNKTQLGTHFPINFHLLDVNHRWKATDLARAIHTWWDNLPPGCWANWIISSHDHSRFNDRVGPEMVDAYNMLTLLLPGTAITYYGDEIGMEDYKLLSKENDQVKSKDGCRTPFQWDDSHQAGFSTATKTWLPVNPNFSNVNLARSKRDPNSHYKVYKRLVETRQTPTAQYGGLLTYIPSEWVFAFTRVLPGQPTYLTMINMGTDYAFVQPTKMIPNSTETLIVQSSSLNSGYSNGEVIPLIQHGKHLDFMMRPKSSVVLMTNDQHLTSDRLPGSTPGPLYLPPQQPPPPTYLPPTDPFRPNKPKSNPDNSGGNDFGFNNERMKPSGTPPVRPSFRPTTKPRNSSYSHTIPIIGIFLFNVCLLFHKFLIYI